MSDPGILQLVLIASLVATALVAFFVKSDRPLLKVGIVAAVDLVLVGALAFLAISPQAATAPSASVALAPAERDRAFDQLTKPRIRLEGDDESTADDESEMVEQLELHRDRPAIVLGEGKDAWQWAGSSFESRSGDLATASDGRNTVTLVIEKQPPEWANRPRADYRPDSAFAKRLYRQLDADGAFVWKTNRHTSLRACLDQEKHLVLNGMRNYVAERSNDRLGDRFALGMSTPEIFERFVEDRRLVDQGDGSYVLHTLVAVRNSEGGDQLVRRTVDQITAERTRGLTAAAAVVLMLMTVVYALLRLSAPGSRATGMPRMPEGVA